jgi:amino acid permease
LFGEDWKGYMKAFLAINNTLFLSVYVLFLGTQTDKLMCETFQVSNCGNEKYWAVIVNVALLPIIFIERLSGVGVFSGIAVFLTIASISLIVYTCQDIYRSD